MSVKPSSEAGGIAEICSVTGRAEIRQPAERRGLVGIAWQSGFYQFDFEGIGFDCIV
jgi:hypothetical protein